jgi:hypothetical protein
MCRLIVLAVLFCAGCSSDLRQDTPTWFSTPHNLLPTENPPDANQPAATISAPAKG